MNKKIPRYKSIIDIIGKDNKVYLTGNTAYVIENRLLLYREMLNYILENKASYLKNSDYDIDWTIRFPVFNRYAYYIFEDKSYVHHTGLCAAFDSVISTLIDFIKVDFTTVNISVIKSIFGIEEIEELEELSLFDPREKKDENGRLAPYWWQIERIEKDNKNSYNKALLEVYQERLLALSFCISMCEYKLKEKISNNI